MAFSENSVVIFISHLVVLVNLALCHMSVLLILTDPIHFLKVYLNIRLLVTFCLHRQKVQIHLLSSHWRNEATVFCLPKYLCLEIRPILLWLLLNSRGITNLLEILYHLTLSSNHISVTGIIQSLVKINGRAYPCLIRGVHWLKADVERRRGF